MIPVTLFVIVLCLVMLLPYLPGRFDASAATFAFVVQVASYVSLLMVPVGLAWLVSQRHSRLWCKLTLASAGLVACVIAFSAMSVNRLAIGLMLGVGAIALIRTTHRRLRANVEQVSHKRYSIGIYLVCVPLILVGFRSTVLPRAAVWSRDRAIQHSSTLIAEIDLFRQRRGNCPVDVLINLRPMHTFARTDQPKV